MVGPSDKPCRFCKGTGYEDPLEAYQDQKEQTTTNLKNTVLQEQLMLLRHLNKLLESLTPHDP